MLFVPSAWQNVFYFKCAHEIFSAVKLSEIHCAFKIEWNKFIALFSISLGARRSAFKQIGVSKIQMEFSRIYDGRILVSCIPYAKSMRLLHYLYASGCSVVWAPAFLNVFFFFFNFFCLLFSPLFSIHVHSGVPKISLSQPNRKNSIRNELSSSVI